MWRWIVSIGVGWVLAVLVRLMVLEAAAELADWTYLISWPVAPFTIGGTYLLVRWFASPGGEPND